MNILLILVPNNPFFSLHLYNSVALDWPRKKVAGCVAASYHHITRYASRPSCSTAI
jgi:hypothetical protein